MAIERLGMGKDGEPVISTVETDLPESDGDESQDNEKDEQDNSSADNTEE